MTTGRDLDSLLDAWLSDGPTIVADRVVDDVASRIARQRQRPAWRLQPWRFPSMTPTTRAAAALTAIVVVTAGLYAAMQPPTLEHGVGGSPSPSPSLSSSRSAPATPTPSVSAGIVHCEDDLPGCAGPLAAGAHGSAQFAPRLIHYDTPDGWTNSIDTSTIYKLDAPGGAASILLWADVAIEDQKPTSCEPAARPGGAAPHAADWVAYLTAHQGLVTSTAAFDFPGNRDEGTRQLDITMAPSWTQTCPGSPDPVVQFIAHVMPPEGVYGIGGNARLRLIVFDTSSYGPHTVLIEIYGPVDEAGFAATLAIIDPVLRSFVFGCGPGAGYGPCSGYPSGSTSLPEPGASSPAP